MDKLPWGLTKPKVKGQTSECQEGKSSQEVSAPPPPHHAALATGPSCYSPRWGPGSSDTGPVQGPTPLPSRKSFVVSTSNLSRWSTSSHLASWGSRMRSPDLAVFRDVLSLYRPTEQKGLAQGPRELRGEARGRVSQNLFLDPPCSSILSWVFFQRCSCPLAPPDGECGPVVSVPCPMELCPLKSAAEGAYSRAEGRGQQG